MDRFNTSTLKLGIIAGGQLAKMLIQEANKWDIQTHVLDQDENCSASGISSVFVQGSHLDYDAVYQFGKQVDLLTYEIESIDIKALQRLKSEGLQIVPDPAILELIQDKGLQKNFYGDHDIPTAPYTLYKGKKDILEAVLLNQLKFPFVQKICKGGYDGHGVTVVKIQDDCHKLLEGPSLVEEKIDIAKEIAVIAARNETGEIRCFPAVEMVFNDQANLVEKLVCPADISPELRVKAEILASKLIESLNMAGLLAVEFFVDTQGNLLVNECAPRTHNSGHHTIESAVTSQFEQHLRAILNLPLGSTELTWPAVMINLLGEPGHEGKVLYEGLAESMAIEGVKIHLYGKKMTRPFRKMGHVTIISRQIEEAIAKADLVKHLIKVKSWE